MKYTTNINFRVTPEQKYAIKKLTKEANMTSPGDYIRTALFGGYEGKEPIEIDIENSSPKKVYITLPGFVVDGLRLRAGVSGIPLSRYISSMLQTRLTESPVFPKRELAELKRSNEMFWKIGTNINQLTKHLNERRKAGSTKEFDPSKYGVFLALKEELKESRRLVLNLVRASKGVW